MKRTLTAALCVIGFVFIAGPIYMKNEVRQVLVNGKPFSKALLINGVWMMPTEDLLKGEVTAEPSYRLKGTSLFAHCATGQHIKKVQLQASSAPDTFAVPKVEGIAANKAVATTQLFRVNRDGMISNNVVMFQGKAYFPVADFVKAVNGGVFNPASSSESFTFNFAVNGNGILALQQ
jgi:hypothetical protein